MLREEDKMGREFCVGDKVIIRADKKSSKFISVLNWEGIITKIDTQASIRVEFNDDERNILWISYEYLELIKAYDEVTPTKAEPLQTASGIKAIIPDQETMKRLEVESKPVYAVDSDDYIAEHKIEQEEKPQDEFIAPDHKGYMVFVSSGSKPKHIHKTYEEALRESHRLANQKENVGAKVYILAVLGAIQGTIEVNEVEV